jgi:hypothetical protein
MSPEQAQGQAVDARSDVFAFGVLLFEMFSGRRPFQGEGMAAVLAAVLRDPAPPLREVRASLPAEAERIVARALETDPVRRYPGHGGAAVGPAGAARVPEGAEGGGRRARGGSAVERLARRGGGRRRDRAATALRPRARARPVPSAVHVPGLAPQPRWSADGATLLFYRELPRPSLMRAPAEGGPQALVLDDWRWPVQTSARLGPDGRTLLYSQFEGGRAVATRIRDLATGGERTLARPIDWARWSRDGSRILGSEGGEVVVCAAADGGCRRVGPGDAPCWSGDGARVYARRSVAPLDGPNFQSLEVWEMGLDGSDARRVASVASQHALSVPFDVSVGEQLVWPEVRRGRLELWLAELGRR